VTADIVSTLAKGYILLMLLFNYTNGSLHFVFFLICQKIRKACDYIIYTKNFSFRFLVVIICLILSVLTTIEKFSTKLSPYVYWIEIFLVLFFGMEYGLRLWSAGCRSKYMGIMGRIRFARKPIAVVGRKDQNILHQILDFL
jgi:hypothetical protein